MKAKDILIPAAFAAFIAAAGTMAVLTQEREREERERLCQSDPDRCPQPKDGSSDDILIVPMPGGGVAFF